MGSSSGVINLGIIAEQIKNLFLVRGFPLRNYLVTMSKSAGNCELFAFIKEILNPLLPSVPFLYTRKISENRRISDVLRGYKMGTLGSNWLREKNFCSV